MKQKKPDGATPREAKPPEGQPPAKRPRRKSQKKLVEKAIQKIEQKLDGDELKPSVGDLIRLLQLKKELEEESPKEIKVSWVEPREEEHAGEK